MRKRLKITLLLDNPGSWLSPSVRQLKQELQHKHSVSLVNDAKAVGRGDLAFFLACERIVGRDILARNRHNLVVHESALPKGRGWSPLTWQILAGRNRIPIALFEAGETVDSGVIYFQEMMTFQGHELIDELRRAQGEATVRLVKRFVRAYPRVTGKKQRGRPSYYPRRRPEDSELDASKPLKSLMNKLRVADNQRYPAFVRYKGQKYLLKIEKAPL